MAQAATLEEEAMSTKAKPPPKRDDPEQSKRFEETAREVEADESGKDFQRAIKAVVPTKRPTPKKPSGA